MNTTYSFRKFIGALTAALAAFIAIGLIPTSRAQDKARPAPERIGVYDSRAVAIAYAGSAVQVKKIKDLTAQSRKARETGNTNEVSRLEAEARTWQANLHKQGFRTAPVDDLLGHIPSDRLIIQRDTGVTRFISKWNQAELDRQSQKGSVPTMVVKHQNRDGQTPAGAVAQRHHHGHQIHAHHRATTLWRLRRLFPLASCH